MIASPIPNQRNAAVGTLLEQILEEGNSALTITCLSRLNQALLVVNIHCPIVSLPTAFVEDGNLNALVCLAPHIPTDVSPQQMAFIRKEDP